MNALRFSAFPLSSKYNDVIQKKIFSVNILKVKSNLIRFLWPEKITRKSLFFLLLKWKSLD